MKLTCSWGEYVKDSRDIYTVDFESVMSYMRYSDKLEWQIEDIRKYRGVDEKKYKKIKDSLVYIVPSILTKAHRHSTAFKCSNLMIFDIDKIDEQTHAKLVLRLREEPLIRFFFRSPSGNGLKVGVAVDKMIKTPEEYSKVYRVYAEQFGKVFGVELDHTSDCVRACFLSYDEDLYYNPGSVPVKKYVPPEPKRSKINYDVSGDETIEKARVLCQKCSCVLSYDDWFRAGAALKSLGAVGEDLFVMLSTGNGSKDSESSIRRKYRDLQSLERISIGSFFEIMKRNGVTF